MTIRNVTILLNNKICLRSKYGFKINLIVITIEFFTTHFEGIGSKEHIYSFLRF